MGEQFRKQHIVPQAYLRRFAVKHGKKYIIGTRLHSNNGNNDKLFTRSVADVAYLENYYDTQAQADIKYWEHFLDREFDTLCGDEPGKIIASITLSPIGKYMLSSSDREILSRIIMSQTIRTPRFIEKIMCWMDNEISEYISEFLKSVPVEDMLLRSMIKDLAYDEDTRKNETLKSFFEAERFNRLCDILRTKKYWIVFYNHVRNSLPYITGDNPVLFSDIKGNTDIFTNIGLLNDGLVILYPISPSILIGIYSQSVYKHFDSKVYSIDDVNFITRVNNLIIAQCRTHAFLPEPLFSAERTGGN